MHHRRVFGSVGHAVTEYGIVYTLRMNELENLDQQVRKLAERLSQMHWRMCTAESCTGGLIAKTLTDLAGSSQWFDRGYITYSNQAKMDMLGVTQHSLQHYGAVSEVVAQEMAQGALRDSGSDVVVSVTGIAGPGGGSELKPVGMVCFGWATRSELHSTTEVFDGDRQFIRLQTTQKALQLLLDLLT